MSSTVSTSADSSTTQTPETESLSGVAMPEAWRQFLESTDALFSDSGVTGFSGDNSVQNPGNADSMVADLSHYGLIEVAGPDAQKFLASLFTGEVRQVNATQGQFTSWCDGKGRIIATFWLLMRSDAYYILLASDLLASTLSGLKRFLLRSKATITDKSTDLVRIGFSGSGLLQNATTLLGSELPTIAGATVDINGCNVMALAGSEPLRWIALGEFSEIKNLWQILSSVSQPVGLKTWELLDIKTGIAIIRQETSGEFIPQMLNLEALGGLSFTKGCYPGQEVVARLQYRGQLKRRLFKATLETDQLPLAGERLFSPDSTESVGQIISAAPLETGGVAVQAVVVIDQQAAGNIHLQDMNGPRLNFEAE